MEADIDFDQLEYEELVRLGNLVAEALALAQKYDKPRAREYCALIAACNAEVLTRRQQSLRQCGTSIT